MSEPYQFPAHYKPLPRPSPDGTQIMRGPVATATDCVWATEIWYRPRIGKWEASIPFLKSENFDTAAEAVAWIESQR